jgi:hypothetical protein
VSGMVMSLPWGFHKPGEFEVVNYRLSTTLMQVLFGTFSFRGVTVRMTSHRPRIDPSLRGREFLRRLANPCSRTRQGCCSVDDGRDACPRYRLDFAPRLGRSEGSAYTGTTNDVYANHSETCDVVERVPDDLSVDNRNTSVCMFGAGGESGQHPHIPQHPHPHPPASTSTSTSWSSVVLYTWNRDHATRH